MTTQLLSETQHPSDRTASDEELIGQVRDGCTEAWAELWVRHRQNLKFYVRARVSCPATAEDIASEALLRAWQNLDKFLGGNVEAWLIRIAGNLALDHLKSGAQRFETAVDTVPVRHAALPARSAADVYDAQQQRLAQTRLVERVLDSLGKDQARCLTLRFFDDRTVKETAEALDRTPGAVKVLQHRALNAARSMADPDELVGCGMKVEASEEPVRRSRHRISVQNRPADEAFRNSETTGPRISAWVTSPRCPSS